MTRCLLLIFSAQGTGACLTDFGSAGWYAKELMAMRWVIVVAEHPTFVTSDNPVTLIHPSLRFQGLSNQAMSSPLKSVRYGSKADITEIYQDTGPHRAATRPFSILSVPLVLAEALEWAKCLRYASRQLSLPVSGS